MNTTADSRPPVDGDERIAAALQALPQLTPSDALMRRLTDAAAGQVEGRPQRAATHGAVRAALLAASLLVAALLIWVPEKYGTGGITGVAATGDVANASQLPALMAQSAYLESVLSSLPDRGRVQRVGTASTITALEDRVAMIDAQLNQPQVRASTAGSEALWRQRVGLMNTLVELRGTPRQQLWL